MFFFKKNIILFTGALLGCFMIQDAYSRTNTPGKSVENKVSSTTTNGSTKNKGLAACEGPLDKVKVSVKQVGLTYVFSITSSLKDEFGFFAIGYGGPDEWQDANNPKAIPKTVKSPKGWKGNLFISETGPGMTVFWSTWDKSVAISSGATFSGFSIEMPAQYDKFKQLPFHMRYFSKRSKCIWGRISQ